MIDFLSCITFRGNGTRTSHGNDTIGHIRKRLGGGAIRKAAITCLICPWILFSHAHALSTDKDKPIHIEADWAEADDMRGTVVYRGEVIVTQGSIRIDGEMVTLHYDENDTLTKAEVEGRPAKFQQRPDGSREKQHAKASRMEYFATRDLIILLGNAHSWQGRRRISADRIEYDTKKNRVRAHSVGARGSKSRDGKSKSRVRIVVPSKKNQ
uniref:Lipopolysaccharide export system protein LptA n=1 Tax=Candidatus Kentrum sp. TC TaxID=2126339 RepID=A0A450Z9S4_9GAMM|nr:MAG: lipopolysaccharide export system protein LptA [Candidatus Kentron sp. TC]VFK50537.1 MAG: lipopolysaccharide export system protein LptA [Candidatus Kentron sp. TC]VFK63917.1 MAG: lipopolysaccharide export system protein LptA [Candidatus Kentron sp. TC]